MNFLLINISESLQSLLKPESNSHFENLLSRFRSPQTHLSEGCQVVTYICCFGSIRNLADAKVFTCSYNVWGAFSFSICEKAITTRDGAEMFSTGVAHNFESNQLNVILCQTTCIYIFLRYLHMKYMRKYVIKYKKVEVWVEYQMTQHPALRIGQHIICKAPSPQLRSGTETEDGNKCFIWHLLTHSCNCWAPQMLASLWKTYMEKGTIYPHKIYFSKIYTD